MKDINLKIAQFKMECYNYLSSQSLNVLRAYGRKIGVERPTERKKGELLDEIVLVLSGEKKAIIQTNLGAPVKNDYLDPCISEKIQAIRMKYFAKDAPLEKEETDYQRRLREFREQGLDSICFHSNDYQPEFEKDLSRPVYRGQLQYFNEVACLLPPSCEKSETLQVILPIELVKEHDLRQGDIVSCYARQTQSAYVAYKILTRNDKSIEDIQGERGRFEESSVSNPAENLTLLNKYVTATPTLKCFDWLFSLKKGQRVCLISSPKSGKTNILYQLAKAAAEGCGDFQTYVLLIEQTPEIIRQFTQLSMSENLITTTYEDDADRQVFTADFVLTRAKRQVEEGKHVLLLVDSITALARSYNETDASSGGKVLAGGLESKTLQYLKKYFGSARAIENGGSLTIIAAMSTLTGNPADELLCGELAAISNMQLYLSDELAAKHIYPAFDFVKTRFSKGIMEKTEETFDRLVEQGVFDEYGNLGVLQAIASSENMEEMLKKLKIK